MATLTIRNLPDEVHRRLRVRAAEAGTSMEAYVRCLLTEASVASEPDDLDPAALQAWVADLYGGSPPRNAVEDLISERRRETATE